jgi:hypothetical protein
MGRRSIEVIRSVRRLEAQEDVVVKSIEPEADGWFDVEDHPVLAEARRTRLAAARVGFDMGIPFNDLNRAFALDFHALPCGVVRVTSLRRCSR